MPWNGPPGWNPSVAVAAARTAWQIEHVEAWNNAAAVAQANAVAAAAAAANAASGRAAIIASINTHLNAISPGAPPDAAGHIAAVQQLLPQLA